MDLVPFLPIVAPAIVGLFTLLAVWISQRGAARVVTRTLEGQRALAHDTAVREYRRQQVTPYLEAAGERIRIWSAMYIEAGTEDKAGILELQTQVASSEFQGLLVSSGAIPDEEFRAAFRRFVDSEGKLKTGQTKAEVMEIVQALQRSLRELHAAAERFIFSS